MNEVETFPQRYAAAVRAKDVGGLLSLYDDGVRLFDLWVVWSHEGASAWRTSVEEWFGSLGEQSVGVDFADVQTTVTDTLATLHAIITYREVSSTGEELGSMQNRLTWVLQKFDDGWRIVHEHTSAPVDFETSKVILQR
ncbi:nuclear transport factor 2 family protein [Arthrobacter tecti]